MTTKTLTKTHGKSPLWEGPYSNGPEGGLTQTLMSKWLVCRHRFWLQAVCGAVDPRDFDIPLHYGDAFHNALETYALGKVQPEKAGQRIKDYFHKISQADPTTTHKAGYWSQICYDQFLHYCKVWKDEDSNLESVAEERPFCLPYTLPSGRVIYLRGKMDGIVATNGGNGRRGIYLFEHKVKGEVDVENLVDTLAQNAQAMFYMPAALSVAKEYGLEHIDGLLYNVIQRPLAGRKHSIKQKKGRKSKDKKTGITEIKGAETQSQFLMRLAGLYSTYPDDFFYRWRVAISPEEIQRFQNECLNPILEQLCDWWDSIQGNPMDPWKTFDFHGEVSKPNKLHYRAPFGVYNKLAKGLTGDYQAYLTKGDKSSLRTTKTLFPELSSK